MSSSTASTRRTPVYFLGIGGPNFIENTAHPAFARLAAVGREITTVVKPKAVVVFSAHWQSSSSRSSGSSGHGGSGGSRGSGVEVNVAEDAGIIYDFYGFPPHFYEYKYPYRGSPAVAEKVIGKLAEAGVGVKRVNRGLDHGVWAGFLAAFDPATNPLDVPIVQVSLYGNEDSDEHYCLGAALQGLRDEGILIVGAGMAVHNLRDYRRAIAADETMPYAQTFDDALRDAVGSADRREAMASLLDRKDAREAHPTLEHVLPIYVCAGAAGSDAGERIWTLTEKSLSWAQYRFGET